MVRVEITGRGQIVDRTEGPPKFGPSYKGGDGLLLERFTVSYLKRGDHFSLFGEEWVVEENSWKGGSPDYPSTMTFVARIERPDSAWTGPHPLYPSPRGA